MTTFNSYVHSVNGMNLLGEVITWSAAGPHSRAKVKQSLTDVGLDDSIVREFLARHAFSRACHVLKEERAIDILTDDKSEIRFQFTRKQLQQFALGEEWVYSKETVLTLNKTTGKVTCEIQPLEELAQRELDRCMDERTTSDITKIVQRLFDKHADLFPIRDQGGAYFVPAKHSDFVAKVQEFLARLGGRVNRFPVPEGTQVGDETVTKTIQEGMTRIVAEHEAAVNNFGETTRGSTLHKEVEAVNQTRIKIEAYAHFLQGRANDLEGVLIQCKMKLREKIRQKESCDSSPEPHEEEKVHAATESAVPF